MAQIPGAPRFILFPSGRPELTVRTFAQHEVASRTLQTVFSIPLRHPTLPLHEEAFADVTRGRHGAPERRAQRFLSAPNLPPLHLDSPRGGFQRPLLIPLARAPFSPRLS